MTSSSVSDLEKNVNGREAHDLADIANSTSSLKASEHKFALRTIGLASVVGLAVLGVGGTSSIGDILRSRGLFLRGHKDDAPTPAPLAIGERCKHNESFKCAEGSFCDDYTCIPCGKEFDYCCNNGGEASNWEEYFAGACQDNLKCAFTRTARACFPQCLKCWANGNTCGVDSTCCDANKTCVDGQCVACGKATEKCCTDRLAFTIDEDFSFCNGADIDCFQFDTCKTCAKENQDCADKPCCGSTTGNELVCDGSKKCVKCGGAGEPPCFLFFPVCDNADLIPNEDTGFCESSPCGEALNQCCEDIENVLAGTQCKDPQTNCLVDDNRDSTCAQCAASGEDCDANTPCCSEDQGCDRFGKCNVCTPCGDFADACCPYSFTYVFPENRCNEDTLACDENSRCANCVKEGDTCSPSQPCCQDGTNPLVCGDDNKCSKCGKKDDPCCFLPYLNDGENGDPAYCSGGLYCDSQGSKTCLDAYPENGSQRLPSQQLPQDYPKMVFPKSFKRQH